VVAVARGLTTSKARMAAPYPPEPDLTVGMVHR
jgi:hypothetical protein